MLLKYIQEGLSLGLKVHDTVLRFQISRLSMHVPDGVLTDMMGIEDCCFGDGGWGTCVCVCLLGGQDGGYLCACPPQRFRKLYAWPQASAQGVDMMWGWPYQGRRREEEGFDGGFVSDLLERDTHTFSQDQTGCITYSNSKKLSFPPCFFISRKTCNPSICRSLLFRSAWCLLEYGRA